MTSTVMYLDHNKGKGKNLDFDFLVTLNIKGQLFDIESTQKANIVYLALSPMENYPQITFNKCVL